VQDIYPVAPLQEGILFHYLIGGSGDPYLLAFMLGFDGRSRLESFLQAVNAVIARHDILRTSIHWEGLSEPVQVVWRHAPLPVEDVQLDLAAGDAAAQLYARYDPRQYRIDVRQAPMWRNFIALDNASGRWLMVILIHHLVADNTSFRFILTEVQAHLLGQQDQLAEPMPFRNLVAQARLGLKE